MMLPSGNDCALALAYGFGSMIIKRKKKPNPENIPFSPVKEFVKEMNKLSIKLGLKNTHFVNPHGLSEKGNRSCSIELGKIAFFAL
jgi:D-alanyl-D-alanine carboxypeptidase